MVVEPLVVGTMEAEMPAVTRSLCMVLRLSLKSMVAVFPFMVTVPEVLDIPSRAATPVEELEKLSLCAPPVTWFLILVPVVPLVSSSR